jgi:hypothetical protein
LLGLDWFLLGLDRSGFLLLSCLISSVLFDHPSLQQLTLSHNNFTSLEVPSNNGVLSRLVALDLSYNELGGLLPAFMGSMPELSALSLVVREREREVRGERFFFFLISILIITGLLR